MPSHLIAPAAFAAHHTMPLLEKQTGHYVTPTEGAWLIAILAVFVLAGFVGALIRRAS